MPDTGYNDDEQPQLSPLALLLSGYGMGARDARNGTTPDAAGAPTGGAPANPAAATPAVAKPAFSPLPTAPTAPDMSPQMARYSELQKIVSQKPPQSTDPNLKPGILDRIFGGMTTFGAALQHNPNAMELGTNVVRGKYNRATEDYERQQQQAKREEGVLGQEMEAGKQGFGQQMDVFHAQMANAQEERQRANEQALAGERGAKAAKYENAFDPNSFTEDKNSPTGYTASRYGSPDKRETAEPPAAFKNKNKPEAEPKNYEEMVLAYHSEKDPARKKALGDAVKHIEEQEKKRFNYRTPDDKPKKPMSPNQQQMVERTKKKDIESARTDFENTIRTVQRSQKLSDDDKKKQIDQAKEDYLDSWQDAQDSYEKSIEGAGYQVEHYDVRDQKNVDQTTLKTMREPSAPSQRSSKKSQPSQPQKPAAKAEAPAGPPSDLWKGRESKALQLRNKTTGKTETWQLVNGQPQKVGSGGQ